MAVPLKNPSAQPAGTLQQAMQAHQAGRLDEARSLYGQLLAQTPNHPDALHLLGLMEAQQGRHAEAARLMGLAIAVHPGESMFHNNLGNVCVERGMADEALDSYRHAHALAPDRPDVCNNLGVLLSRRGQTVEALQLLQRAVELAPSFADARQNLANHHLRQGDMQQAMEVCVAGLLVAPRNPLLRRVLGQVYCSLGRDKEAAALYRAWLADEPDNPEAQFRLVASTQENVPDRAPDRYLAATFDDFADSFDAKLAALSYRAPEMLAEAVARHAGPPAAAMDVLDAGCGTGLCGPLVKPWARSLVGVDLSNGMLAKAEARQVYDALAASEMVAYIAARPGSCDLLVSADTLIYFGALEAFAAAARAALRDGGLLVFSVEAHADAAGAPDFILHGHGRYSHRRGYLEQVLAGAGLALLELQSAILRMEARKPVDGWVVSARARLAH